MKNEALEETTSFLREYFRLDGGTPLAGDTAMTDIVGWDSLSYTMLVIALEQRFNIALPAECVFEAKNIDSLNRLIVDARR